MGSNARRGARISLIDKIYLIHYLIPVSRMINIALFLAIRL